MLFHTLSRAKKLRKNEMFKKDVALNMNCGGSEARNQNEFIQINIKASES